MKVLFADTSFYVAIFSPQDALHARAKAVAELGSLDVPGQGVVTAASLNFP
jgi:predicted nucleic acid-binding protein